MSWLKASALAAAVAVVLATPFLVSRGTVNLLALASIYALAGLGVSLLLGYCGIVTLAQSAFYGVGAYSTSYFTVNESWSSWGGMAAGTAVSAVIAYALGRAVLRLEGYYLSLGTLALATIAFILFNQADGITGGSLGVGGIPELSVFGWALSDPRDFYFFGWALAGVAMLLGHRLVTSRSGLAMRALRDHPAAARSLGVDIEALRLKTFVLSAVLGAAAGSLYGHYANYISVESFDVRKGLLFVLVAVLGGTRHVWGPAVGAVFITLAPELLDDFGEFHQVLFGLVLVLVIIVAPDGLGGTVARRLRTSGAPA